MKKIKYSILVLICSLAGIFPAKAQGDSTVIRIATAVKDTIAVNDTTPPKRRQNSRDISHLTLQKRYRPKDEPSALGRIFSDMYIWGHGSFYLPFARDYGHGPMAMGGIGKWFSDKKGLHRYHGVRLGFGGGYFMDKYEGNRVKLLALNASYLFDLGAYVNGYAYRRIVSVMPIAGVGYTFTDGALTGSGMMNSRGLSAHIGVDLEFRLFPGVDLVIEPLLEFQQDPRKLVRQNIWRAYYPVFRGDVGLNFHLDRRYWRQVHDAGKDLRVSISGGPRMQYASNLFDSENVRKISQMIGWDVAAGVNRKYNNWFYLRLQASYAKDYWWLRVNDLENGMHYDRKNATHISGRVDAMVNLLGFVPTKDTRERRFGLLVFVGPEAGLMQKEGVESPDELRSKLHPFIGAQGGLQFRLRLLHGLQVYLEPRVGIVPYYAPSNNPETKIDNYSDFYGTVSLGMEYTLGRSRQSSASKTDEQVPIMDKSFRTQKERTSDWGGFFRDTYVWAQTGFNNPLVKDCSYGTMAALGVGKWFIDRKGMRRLHGMRLGADFGYYFDEVLINHIMSIKGYASYLFDLSSSLRGFNPNRFISIIPLVGVGAGVTEMRRDDFDGLDLSAHLGTDLNVQVLPGVELVVEPLFEIHSDPRKPIRDGKEQSVYVAFRGSMGVNYHLDRKYWTRAGDPGRDWRVSLSGGARIQFSSQAVPVGWDVAAGVSRQFNDWFHLRVQAGYALDGWWTEDKNGNRQRQNSKHLAARVDAMFDLLGFSSKNSDHRMGLLLFAGPEAGLMRSLRVNDLGAMHPFVGAQAGLQLKYKIIDNVAIYLEPRAGVIPYHMSSSTLPGRFESFSNWYGSFSLGVEYSLGHRSK